MRYGVIFGLAAAFEFLTSCTATPAAQQHSSPPDALSIQPDLTTDVPDSSPPDRMLLPHPNQVFLDRPIIRDAQGGQLISRGFNLSGRSKRPPFFPGADTPSGFVEWSADRLTTLKLNGLNTVRFLIIWEALEPMPGQIDSSYISHVLSWVQALEKNGFWVILDMHQDLYSRAFAGIGDGAPAWSCPHMIRLSSFRGLIKGRVLPTQSSRILSPMPRQ